MGFWSSTTKLITGAEPRPRTPRRRNLTRRDLIRMESKIGAQLFGTIPVGHRREFFYLDNNTWVWYEEWTDNTGKQRELTTRYEIHQNGVLKVQDGQPYAVVEGDELRNLYTAIRLYYERTSREIYKRDPGTRQPLAA
jgi:hypothetical protein